MKERRKLERFSLQMAAKIKLLSPAEGEFFSLTSSNISAGGAFFPTSEPITEGARVQLILTIPSEILQKLTGTQSMVEIQGTVVRSEPTGIAIRFDKNYQISPFATA
jgi:hypothetical protein